MRPRKYNYKQIYKLAFVDGKNYQEIAKIVGCPNPKAIQKILRQRADEIVCPFRGPQIYYE